MSKQTKEIKSALEGLAGDRDTYILNNAKIQRNAITWLSQLLHEREQMVEAMGKILRYDEGNIDNDFYAMKGISQEILQQIGELDGN